MKNRVLQSTCFQINQCDITESSSQMLCSIANGRGSSQVVQPNCSSLMCGLASKSSERTIWIGFPPKVRLKRDRPNNHLGIFFILLFDRSKYVTFLDENRKFSVNNGSSHRLLIDPWKQFWASVMNCKFVKFFISNAFKCPSSTIATPIIPLKSLVSYLGYFSPCC